MQVLAVPVIRFLSIRYSTLLRLHRFLYRLGFCSLNLQERVELSLFPAVALLFLHRVSSAYLPYSLRYYRLAQLQGLLPGTDAYSY